jgi:acyl-[acyl carrier protein]--UDP-N-acetylglucosamine O-acyltransferase
MAIDTMARVADGARIGDGLEIGPYCVVGPHVELKDGVRLIGQVNITGATTLGEDRRLSVRVAGHVAAVATIAASRPNSLSAHAARYAKALP